MLRRTYKAPGFAQGKTGEPHSIDNIFDENKNPNPFPIGNKFGFFMYGGA